MMPNAKSVTNEENIPFLQYRRYQLQSELCEIVLFLYVCFQSLGHSYQVRTSVFETECQLPSLE